MMRIKKIWLTTIAALLCSITASAQDFSFDGIYYNITSSTDLTVEVTYIGRNYDEYSNEYTGAVTIPSAVVYYDNEIYKVTSIGDFAFRDCYGLTSITIPEEVTSIGSSAFWGCSNLTSIIIPASVTSLGIGVFCYCSNLTSLNVAEGNAVYDSRNNCNAIIQTNNNTLIVGCSNTVIPENVTSIGGSAFEGCYGLTSITIPEGVTSIGDRAFWGCSNLTSITIPASVTSVGSCVLSGCSNLTSLHVAEGNAVYDSRNNCNAIIQTNNNTLIVGCPGTIIPESVTNIGNYAFSNCAGLTSITIPDGVTSIEGSAFSYCSGLTSITIPASVTSVGSRVLSGCSNLTSLHVAEGNAVYDSRNNCNAIIQTSNNTMVVGCSKTIIPEGVTRIGNAAFNECSGLTSIIIPKSVTRIEENAFSGCTGLWTVINYSDLTIQKRSRNNGYVGYYARRIINGEDIVNDYAFETIDGVHYLIGYIGDDTELTLPENFQGENYQLGDDAFYGCSSLTSITIPECVTSIGNSAFSGCSSLTSITIPECVTSIGSQAFYDCSGLTSITIPECVTSIGNSAFSGCSNLESISINCSNVGSWFSGIQSIKKVVLGESVTSIGNSAFYGCSSLTSITIPESVTEIGDDAFYYCSSLTSISIPDGVTSIGNSVFDGCSSLASITVPESVTEIGDDAFYGCTGELIVNCNIPSASYYSSDGVFYGSKFSSVIIGEKVTSIGNYAFYGCKGLCKVINYSNLSISAGSSSNGYVAYYAKQVIDGSELTTAGDFHFITSNDTYYLANYIGQEIDVVLPNDYNGSSYDIGQGAFAGSCNLTSITIPEGVTSIGDYAFYDCSGLTSLVISKNIKSIKGNTFAGCSGLKELTLGEGLKRIEEGAFSSSKGLEKITIYATQPPTTGGFIFSDEVYENAALYVPQGCVSKYQVMTGWSGFYNISEVEGGTPDYLTIRQADNGAVKIAIDLGRTYKVRVEPTEGWSIHSVTFDGVDMTAQLDENYTFTTPTLTGSAVLNVAYEQNVNRVESVNKAVKIRGYEGELFISGTEVGDRIAVYTSNGVSVAESIADGTSVSVSVSENQLYIVQVAGKVVKIQM